MMRYMLLVKGNQDYEAGILPDAAHLAEMVKFNEELVKAGVLLAVDALHPTSKGTRIKFSAGKRTVTDGPFAETKELVAGYWMWTVKSKEEAIEWLKRAPFDDAEVELRPVMEAEDLGGSLDPRTPAAG